MPIQQQGDEGVIRFIAQHMVCEVCGSPYTRHNVQVVFHQNMTWMLQAICPTCQAQQVMTAYDQPPYAQLRKRDQVAPSPVTPADVERWAAFLARFHGDMYDLLAMS
ncbi:MAG: hypothetical protein JW966_01510 [Anaerolineae bacterium]|nr:hypothetical protein [Anaerolineae bacterium]